MQRQTIGTDRAPAAIGTYSQAVRVGETVYLSGQIPLVPETMELVGPDVQTQVEQVFDNLAAVCEAAGGSLQDLVRLTIYLTDLGDFQVVNAAMAARFNEPYPARAAIGINELPRGSRVEIDGILILGSSA